MGLLGREKNVEQATLKLSMERERGGLRSSGDVRHSRASCGAEREGDRSKEQICWV